MAEQSLEPWREEDSQVFLSYGADFTPERDFQYELISQLAGTSKSRNWVVDLCCGGGDLLGRILEDHPEFSGLGLDLSSVMREAAFKRLFSFGNRARVGGFDKEGIGLASQEWRNPDLVESGTISAFVAGGSAAMGVHGFANAGKFMAGTVGTIAGALGFKHQDFYKKSARTNNK